ncbi:MAG TPA: class I SAM-dependent methyltransferase [Candidatus Aquilonibacter sp.]|nr:class I SAM-dependent methyltransferase [Candidatus Aquilonibacter sp.]
MAALRPIATANGAGEYARVVPRTKTGNLFAVPPCPLCRRRENAKAFSDNGCELRACRNCGLFFVHPYPVYEARHDEVATGKLEGIELLDCERRYAGERFYYDRHFALIEEECEGAKSFLDVGCGTGHLLERLSGRGGLYRMGIELNSRAASFARRAAGCEIVEVPFEEFEAPRKFDAIALINVFSHIPSLDRLFGALRNALAPGGKVILRTSEMSRHVSRWNQLHWGIPDDLHFLGLGTLDFLCKKYGFRVRRHIRLPYEEELFLRSRWQQMGRRGAINLVKRAGVRVPGALRAAKLMYRAAVGQRLFVSFLVLAPIWQTDAGDEAGQKERIQ